MSETPISFDLTPAIHAGIARPFPGRRLRDGSFDAMPRFAPSLNRDDSSKSAVVLAVIAFALLPVASAQAQTPVLPSRAPTVLPTVNIIGSTPLLGSGIEADKVPGQVSVLGAPDIIRNGTPSLTRALSEQMGGVTVNNAAGNPYQPDLFYHGFQASPLQGTQQGLAVYVNGVRFNQAFGDTVNWELIPDLAIDRVNLEGSNPAFGLNALGGALNVQLKNGFTYQGFETDVSGGSFGRKRGDLQYGKQVDDFAVYFAGSRVHEDGWRDKQSSNIENFYGDLGWRGDRAEVHLNVTVANSTLNGPGTAPVELVAADRRALFTGPNLIGDKYRQVSLAGSYQVSDTVSIQGNSYYSYFQQRVSNGNSPGFGPCSDGSGALCVSPGVFLTDTARNLIPDYLNGGPYSQLSRQSTITDGYGAAVQVTSTDTIFGFENHAVAGLSFDGAMTIFGAQSIVGGLTPYSRSFIGPGIPIDLANGSIVPVRVGISNAAYGVFATDTLDITSRLSVTLSGRLNVAKVDLHDQIGSALNGNHAFSHFNPAAGVTYKVTPWLNVYAGYSDANRTPTPAELSCANASTPCSLANFFVGDPDLKQVVAHTLETGLRGSFQPFADATLAYSVGLFHTDLEDDILFVNSPVQGRAFFQNVGLTRRQGVDAGLKLTMPRWQSWIGYAYTDATFRSGFIASSQNNPAADANGNILVQSGARLPGLPAHRVTLGVNYKVTDAWTVGATAVGVSGTYLFGDEANLTPKLPGYFVVNLTTSYQVTEHLQLFGSIENVTDQQYYVYGTFSPTSSVFLSQAPNATNPRSYNLASPIGGFGGMRLTF